MSRPLRLEFPGSLWHVTVRGNERRPIFFDDRDRLTFLELLGDCAERSKWILPTYALMPNHFHMVTQLTATTLSRGMQWLNSTYARKFNRRHHRVGHLFQGRFNAVLIDKETHYLEVLRYVVLNPVRAGMVNSPEKYVWSSHRAIIGAVAAPEWLAVDDVLVPFGATRGVARRRYRDFVNAGIGSTSKPWDGVVGQIYLGGQEWIEKVREQIALKPRADEHPRTQRQCGEVTMADIVVAVARTLSIDEDRVRYGHGGLPRLIAAWVGCFDAYLSNREIAAGLRLRSASHVSALIRQCDRELSGNPTLRGCVDRCISTIGRKNRQPQT